MDALIMCKASPIASEIVFQEYDQSLGIEHATTEISTAWTLQYGTVQLRKSKFK